MTWILPSKHRTVCRWVAASGTPLLGKRPFDDWSTNFWKNSTTKLKQPVTCCFHFRSSPEPHYCLKKSTGTCYIRPWLLRALLETLEQALLQAQWAVLVFCFQIFQPMAWWQLMLVAPGGSNASTPRNPPTPPLSPAPGFFWAEMESYLFARVSQTRMSPNQIGEQCWRS